MITYSSPGTYVLADDVLETGDVAIRITANDVTLNLNNKTVRCVPIDPSTARTIGIQVQGDRAVIWGGSIEGCHTGVIGARLNTFLVDLNISATAIGTQFGGAGNTIRRVNFRNIVGFGLDAYAIGVNGIGHDGTVEYCTFDNIYRQPGVTGVGEGVGIIVEDGAQRVALEHNTIRNARVEANSIGVWAAVNTTGRIINNTVTNFTRPIVIAGSMTEAGNTISNTTPPPPPPPDGRWFRISVDDGETVYEGFLAKVAP